MSADVRNSYHDIPYQSYPYVQSSPDRLATIALLRGLKPRPPERCRFLELGCAAGGNIIPLALTLPESTFLGIDLSAVQLAEGQEIINRLGLSNIELRRRHILDLEDSLGTFDFIVCHGVYSWVP